MAADNKVTAISKEIRSTLRGYGFSLMPDFGKTHVKEEGEYLQGVEFSSFTTGGRTRNFVINVALVAYQINSHLSSVGYLASDKSWTLAANSGYVNGGSYRSWSIDSDDLDAGCLSDEIQEHLRTVVLPFLAKSTSLQAILNLAYRPDELGSMLFRSYVHQYLVAASAAKQLERNDVVNDVNDYVFQLSRRNSDLFNYEEDFLSFFDPLAKDVAP